MSTRPATRPVVTAVDGSFALSNSRQGMPIFSLDGIAPGESVTGSVEIANSGESAAGLTLADFERQHAGVMAGVVGVVQELDGAAIANGQTFAARHAWRRETEAAEEAPPAGRGSE